VAARNDRAPGRHPELSEESAFLRAWRRVWPFVVQECLPARWAGQIRVRENFARGENRCTLRKASLGSYGRRLLGAIVTVTESDFDCCVHCLVAWALKKAQLDPSWEA